MSSPPRRTQLESMVGALRAEEQSILQERAKLLQVVERRVDEHKRLVADMEALQHERSELGRGAGAAALTRGDAEQLARLDTVRTRIANQLAALQPGVEESLAQVRRAEERYELVEQDRIRVAIEKKKIEKLLEGDKEQRQRMAAEEENRTSEDLAIRRR